MSFLRVSRKEKEKKLNQRGQVIWFTGLPSSGKTTLAIALERQLFKKGKAALILDGDEQREGLNSNLGFSEKDRFENIRRLAETAKFLKNQGIIVLVSAITPLESMRELAKDIIGKEDFSLVYIETSIEECEKRDVKGLYTKARNGEISGFTGIDSIFEIPRDVELKLNTEQFSLDTCTVQFNSILKVNGVR